MNDQTVTQQAIPATPPVPAVNADGKEVFHIQGEAEVGSPEETAELVNLPM